MKIERGFEKSGLRYRLIVQSEDVNAHSFAGNHDREFNLLADAARDQAQSLLGAILADASDGPNSPNSPYGRIGEAGGPGHVLRQTSAELASRGLATGTISGPGPGARRKDESSAAGGVADASGNGPVKGNVIDPTSHREDMK